MRSFIFGIAGVVVLASITLSQTEDAQSHFGQPQYARDHALVRPQNYREWIYLSSGFGMEYSAAAGRRKMFTNVFVTPVAYHRFMTTGRWPEKTMFVLEERFAAGRGSINRSGRYQTDLAGLAASVKDGARFPERWAYFSFRIGERTSQAQPNKACWTCHHTHGAVDNTFVQFYPILKEAAQHLGVYDQAKASESSTR